MDPRKNNKKTDFCYDRYMIVRPFGTVTHYQFAKLQEIPSFGKQNILNH